LVYLAINLDKNTVSHTNLSSELITTTEVLPGIVCIDLNASVYPGKQVECLLTSGVLTGYSISHSVSTITNMTVRE